MVRLDWLRVWVYTGLFVFSVVTWLGLAMAMATIWGRL